MARGGKRIRPAGFLPPGVLALFGHRLLQLSGVVVLALAGTVAAALITFDAADPSWNHATGGAVGNALGRAGAHAADAMLQAAGLAAALPVVVMLAWGLRLLFTGAVVAGLWLRLAALVAAMLLGSAALAGWPTAAPGLPAGLGGAAGRILLGGLIEASAASGLVARGATGVLALVCGGLAIVGAGFAAGLSWREWIRAGAGLGGVGAALAEAGTALGGMGGRLRDLASRRVPPLEKVPRRLRTAPPADRREPNLFDQTAAGDAAAPVPAALAPGSDPADAGLRTELVAPRAPRPAPGKREREARQGVLDLALPGEGYSLPPLSLLALPPARVRPDRIDEDALAQNARMLEAVLQEYGVKGEIVKVRPGPVVTLYELEPAPGIKSARVIGLADDIARSMSALSVRIAVIPGRNVIGIELPNVRRETVYLRELLASEPFERAGSRLTLVLGKDISGSPVMVDLARMPHLLIAGTTGSGKSVAINTMILSLLYRLAPEECRVIMIDPKMLELSVYDGIPHLLAPVVTEPGKAVVALKWAVREMEDRYRAMSQLGVRNIAGYNQRLAEARAKGETLTRTVQTGFDGDTGKPIYEEQELDLAPLPFIVVVVDEMADLMLVAGKDIEAAVQRLAQMARAAGIHLIMATQRPSVDVITGTIKANFPTRISFQVTSKIDSRTILNEQGAEQLLGQGDMLYMAPGGRILRVHGPLVSDGEVEKVVEHLRAQGEPAYLEEVTEEEEGAGEETVGGDGGSGDELYDQAVALVARERKASTSFIQRHLQIGYNRAARIIERMEAEGVVSRANHVGKREVLLRREDA